MNEESLTARRLPNITTSKPNRRPGPRWWESPGDLRDVGLMLAVRACTAVDRAVARYRRKAA
jgi:hypothetical protein